MTHLYERDAALLLLRMGGGKTVITGAAIAELYREGHITSALVVAPKMVADRTWRSELQEWSELADLRVSVALGNARQRGLALEAPADIHVVTYDNLQWLADAYPARVWDLVVMDEITRFNSGGKRYKAFRGFLDRAKIRWGLTGSFCANSLTHAFYPVRAVDLGATFGRTVTPFYRQYFSQGMYEWVPRGGAAEAIGAAVAHLCCRPDPSVYQSQLPPIVYQTHEFEMPWARDYLRLREEFALQVGDDVLTAASAGVLAGKLQQAASGFIYSEAGTALGLGVNTRLALLKELIAEAEGEPVLVWYWFRETGQQLARELGAPDLTQVLDDWNAGRVPVAICQPRSGGHGLNAQHGGSRMIWYEGTWSEEERQQAVARLHRQGQAARTVYVHDIMATCGGEDAIDHAMAAKRAGKLALADAVQREITA